MLLNVNFGVSKENFRNLEGKIIIPFLKSQDLDSRIKGSPTPCLIDLYKKIAGFWPAISFAKELAD